MLGIQRALSQKFKLVRLYLLLRLLLSLNLLLLLQALGACLLLYRVLALSLPEDQRGAHRAGCCKEEVCM